MENKKFDAIKMQQMIARGVMDTELDSPATPLPADEPLPQEPPKRTESHKESEPKEVPERAKRKTLHKGDYESLFIFKNDLKERKTIYIAKEMQDKLAEIVMSMKNRDMTIGIYVENIIQHHFEVYKNEINQLNELKFKKLL